MLTFLLSTDAKHHCHNTSLSAKRVFLYIFEFLLLIAIVTVGVSFFFSQNFSSFFDDEDDDAAVREENEFDKRETGENFMTKYDELEKLSLCLSLFAIENKARMSAVCLINQSIDFFESFNFCKSHNLSLLSIKSEEMKQKIFENLSKFFGVGASIWINGKWSDENKKWLTHPNGEEIDANVPLEVEDFCLKIASSTGKSDFHFSSFPCHMKLYFLCELL